MGCYYVDQLIQPADRHSLLFYFRLMLTSLETAQVISTTFPELAPSLRVARGRSGFYSQLDSFAVFTSHAIDGCAPN